MGEDVLDLDFVGDERDDALDLDLLGDERDERDDALDLDLFGDDALGGDSLVTSLLYVTPFALFAMS